MKQRFTLFSLSTLILFTFYSRVFCKDLTLSQIYEKVNDFIAVTQSYGGFNGKFFN